MSEFNERDLRIAYWDEVRAIAREAVEAELTGDGYATDKVHEAVDDNQWIIYTWRNLVVLRESDNKDAWTEVYKLLPSDNWLATVAYWAMHADIMAQLDVARAELAEESRVAV